MEGFWVRALFPTQRRGTWGREVGAGNVKKGKGKGEEEKRRDMTWKSRIGANGWGKKKGKVKDMNFGRRYPEGGERGEKTVNGFESAGNFPDRTNSASGTQLGKREKVAGNLRERSMEERNDWGGEKESDSSSGFMNGRFPNKNLNATQRKGQLSQRSTAALKLAEG